MDLGTIDYKKIKELRRSDKTHLSDRFFCKIPTSWWKTQQLEMKFVDNKIFKQCSRTNEGKWYIKTHRTRVSNSMSRVSQTSSIMKG